MAALPRFSRHIRFGHEGMRTARHMTSLPIFQVKDLRQDFPGRSRSFSMRESPPISCPWTPTRTLSVHSSILSNTDPHQSGPRGNRHTTSKEDRTPATNLARNRPRTSRRDEAAAASPNVSGTRHVNSPSRNDPRTKEPVSVSLLRTALSNICDENAPRTDKGAQAPTPSDRNAPKIAPAITSPSILGDDVICTSASDVQSGYAVTASVSGSDVASDLDDLTSTSACSAASKPSNVTSVSACSADSHLGGFASSFGSGAVSGPAHVRGGRPLVVLFPWRGCSAKLRAKYSGVYQRLGLEVLCLSEGMSVPVCCVPPLFPLVTRQVLHVLQDPTGPFAHRPLLLHCMSGGYLFAGSMLNLLATGPQTHTTTTTSSSYHHHHPHSSTPHPASPSPFSNNFHQSKRFPSVTAEELPSENGGGGLAAGDFRDRVVGMVFDCPLVSPDLARRGILSSVSSPWLRVLLRAYLSFCSPLLDPVYRKYGQAMVTLDKSPKLVLHALSDRLCPEEQVHEVVSHLEARGVSVQVRAFPGADHVRLLGQDPGHYQLQILQFVETLGLVRPAGG